MPRIPSSPALLAGFPAAAGVAHAAGPFAGVFPANAQTAVDARHLSPVRRAAVVGRLPLQIPPVPWARSVRRGAAR
ncbi:hypothetical protein [Streptomyces sp. NPDC090445]|uniref:hypothetical protein n=1 Tax=Streptomyces sp. NPDC090445 TaxID=3365963 RepID=UPI0038271F51